MLDDKSIVHFVCFVRWRRINCSVTLFQTSIIFDIKLGGESDGYVKYHHPALSPLPIKPFTLKLTGKSDDINKLPINFNKPNYFLHSAALKLNETLKLFMMSFVGRKWIS